MWASKWNDRAYYSCKKAGIGQEFVQMAVLVQRLVEAEYAFVIHTVNPSNNDADYMYAEVVVGLGETLVGNFPGRALGFQMRKDGTEAPEIQSLPSKSTGLFGGGLSGSGGLFGGGDAAGTSRAEGGLFGGGDAL